MGTGPRVCVIGWDGADWRILRPLLDAGYLPHMKSWLERARVGTLLSTLPPVTAPAWSTFLSGVNPGRHGLFTWLGPMNARGERPLRNASHVRAPRLWDWLSEAGLRSLFLNVPMTYPPPAEFNGVLVAGMLTPGTHVSFTSPQDVREVLLRVLPDYQVDVEMQYTEKDRTSPAGMRAHLEEVRRATEQRVQAWHLLWEKYGPFDVATIVFEAPDRIQHPLYGYAADDPPPHKDPHWEERREWVRDAYKHLDALTGEILAMCADATVFFLSDHGFGPLTWEFCANEWLAARGWLRFKAQASHLYRPLRPLARWAKRILPRGWVERGRAAFVGLKALDWQETLAYSGGPMEDGIWLNVRGREPWGIVPPAEYENVRERIIQALREVTLPDGRPLCKGVYRREEVYEGPWVSQAADIILELNEGVRFTSLRHPEGGVFRAVLPPGQGTHRREGVVAVSGPTVARGTFDPSPHIADLAPTLLAVLDIPVPEAHMDGRVLPDVAPHHRVGEALERQGEEKVAYSEEEARLVEEHLRSLGYID